jgi:hypothetical protein
MPEIVVNAEKHVAGVYIDLTYGVDDFVQGTVQVLLTLPETARSEAETPVSSSVASSVITKRLLADTNPEVQAAIETLKTAVLVWEQEDSTPPPEPET